MKITNEVINTCNEYLINLEELAYLYNKLLNLNWNLTTSPSSLAKLKRLNMLDEELNITSTGQAALVNIIQYIPTKVVVEIEDKFEEIWKIFPKDDSFRHFPNSRMIRWNKPETKRLYAEAIQEYSHERLINALKKEIDYRSLNSTKENLFKYMKGSVNWFRDKSYLNFMDEEIEQKGIEHGKELA